VIRIREYVGEDGFSPFGGWFERLPSPASEKVTVALYRMGSGNLSNAKGVGSGVSEFRIDFGPGYRVYFGRDGETLIILLGGGSKQRQNRDIQQAIECWTAYRKKKKVK
jgi:putative addiction module killer protein